MRKQRDHAIVNVLSILPKKRLFGDLIERIDDQSEPKSDAMEIM